MKDSVTSEFGSSVAGSIGISAGDKLRDARTALGYSIEDMAVRLRISRRYLAALEAGRPQDLPGPTYLQGFVRSYAIALGLDADEMVRHFCNAPAATPRIHAATNHSDGTNGLSAGAVSALVGVAFCGLIAVGGSAVWWWSSEKRWPVARAPQANAVSEQREREREARTTSTSEALITPREASPTPRTPAAAPLEAEAGPRSPHASSEVALQPPSDNIQAHRPTTTVLEHEPTEAPVTSNAQQPATTRRDQVVTLRAANVRAGPNGSTEILRTVSGSVRLTAFARAGGWVRVGDTEPWGWIHFSLLESAE